MKVIITYKRVKRLSMRITQKGEVHVSAPAGIDRAEVERFVRSNEDWIRRTLAAVEQRLSSRTRFYDQLPLTTKQQQRDAIDRLMVKCIPLFAKYEPLMGVHHSGITIKRVISKWGSCNVRTRRITLSIYLLLLPDWCIEHVVVHELAHLLVPNHSPAFHRVMDTYFPRWREARAETRRLSREE